MLAHRTMFGAGTLIDDTFLLVFTHANEEIDKDRLLSFINIYEADHFRDSPCMGARDGTSTCVNTTCAASQLI